MLYRLSITLVVSLFGATSKSLYRAEESAGGGMEAAKSKPGTVGAPKVEVGGPRPGSLEEECGPIFFRRGRLKKSWMD